MTVEVQSGEAGVTRSAKQTRQINSNNSNNNSNNNNNNNNNNKPQLIHATSTQRARVYEGRAQEFTRTYDSRVNALRPGGTVPETLFPVRET